MQLRRYFAFLLVAVLTVASSVAADRLAHGNAAALETAAARLKQVPDNFGDWQKSEKDDDIQTAVLEMLECQGYIAREYRHRGTGQTIKMFVIVGPPGPTSVHSPEICYSSAGYESREDAQRFFVQRGDSSPALWKVWLKSSRPVPSQLAVVFGWNAGEGWVAPDHPRFAFAGKPFLYKFQMATSVGDDAEAADNGCQQFLESFLPVLDAALFGRQAG